MTDGAAKRRVSRPIDVGGVRIGGDAPISIQSMTNVPTDDVVATRGQIARLAAAGADLVRVAVPHRAAAEALPALLKGTPCPLVADIHFDHRLAVAALEAGVHALRINPGNWPNDGELRRVAHMAKARGVPIRVGVNAGSLRRDVIARYGGVTARALCASALQAASLLTEEGFDALCVSIKASSPRLMIEANRLIASQTPWPLHLGVTEAGTPREGVLRSAIGIGTLLAEGVGDTIRVSLTADPVEEIHAAKAILKALDLRRGGPTLIACPTCGRTQVKLVDLATRVEAYLKTIEAPITVAVMGCVVNGPGEAREADVGVAGGDGEYVLFRQGQVIAKVKEAEVFSRLIAAIEALRTE